MKPSDINLFRGKYLEVFHKSKTKYFGTLRIAKPNGLVIIDDLDIGRCGFFIEDVENLVVHNFCRG